MAAVYKNYNRGLGLLLWKLDKFRISSNSIRFKHVGGISISSILQDYSIGSDVNVKVIIQYTLNTGLVPFLIAITLF